MRISGSYNLKTSPSICQQDFQIDPKSFKDLGEIKLPISGPFTIALGKHGNCYLYSSYPSETPLYFSIKNHCCYWDELQRKLPGRAQRVKPGYLVHASLGDYRIIPVQTKLPSPAIRPHSIELEDAIAEYWQLLLLAVQRRLATCPPGKIAVSCSGGADSLLLCRALKELNVDFTAFTACLDSSSWDIKGATATLQSMGVKPPVAVLIDEHFVRTHIQEALSLYEYLGPTHKYNQAAITYLALALAAAAHGCTTIFNGHGQDDIHGNIRTIYKELKTEDNPLIQAELWRDERIRALYDMKYLWNDHKLFSSIFRHYDISVRMPYFDWDLVTWALSQPINIIPVDKTKPFVKKAASALLPAGPWNNSNYSSTGYTKGTGWENTNSRFLAELVEKLSNDIFEQSSFLDF